MRNLMLLPHPPKHGRSSVSRRKWEALAIVPLLFAGSMPVVAAQDQKDTSSAELIARARDYYGIRDSLDDCDTGDATTDEIVVCARRAPNPKFQRFEPPPARPEPRMIAVVAPPAGAGVGVSVVVRMCFLQKCPRELYFIDMKSIPEAPPGSDADKIARGEAPAR